VKQKQNLYPTDNLGVLETSIANRTPMYHNLKRSDWKTSEAHYHESDDGERVLKINDLEIMGEFQAPYMRVLAQSILVRDGIMLNIGFGLGLADSVIQEYGDGIKEHHIVEINEDVFSQAEAWKSDQPHQNKIVLHQGDWKDVMPDLNSEGRLFDGILYDGYPLEVQELCRDSVDFIGFTLGNRMLTEHKGKMAFYLDATEGMGQAFKGYLFELGVTKISEQRVPVQLPNRKLNHWFTSHFIAPLLEDVRYGERD